MLRQYLWNTQGKEVLEFDKDRIIYHADYGWFKDSRTEFSLEDLGRDLLEGDAEGTATLHLLSSETDIRMVLPIAIKDAETLAQLIAELLPNEDNN